MLNTPCLFFVCIQQNNIKWIYSDHERAAWEQWRLVEKSRRTRTTKHWAVWALQEIQQGDLCWHTFLSSTFATVKKILTESHYKRGAQQGKENAWATNCWDQEYVWLGMFIFLGYNYLIFFWKIVNFRRKSRWSIRWTSWEVATPKTGRNLSRQPMSWNRYLNHF